MTIRNWINNYSFVKHKLKTFKDIETLAINKEWVGSFNVSDMAKGEHNNEDEAEK